MNILTLARQAPLKKRGVELDLLKDIVMLLMIQKGIREGICNSVHRYAKTNYKYINDYDENKESSYINSDSVYNKTCLKTKIKAGKIQYNFFS